MYYLIAYDISDNKTRRLAVKLCKKAGLQRIQRSVFAGASQSWHIQTIRDELAPLLDAKTDSLTIQPLDKAAYGQLSFTGKKWSKKDIAREYDIVFI